MKFWVKVKRVSKPLTLYSEKPARPVVFIVRQSSDNAETDISESDIENLCRENLFSYKRSKAVFFINEEELPRSITGKIQRHELESRLER